MVSRRKLAGAILALAFAAASPPSVAQAAGLLFHASFDGPEEGDAFLAADVAAAKPSPRRTSGVERREDGRFGAAARVPVGGLLAYDAWGNIRARRGTLAFWVQSDAPLFSEKWRSGGNVPVPLLITGLQRNHRRPAFWRIAVHGPRRELVMRGMGHWRDCPEWQPGEWHHLALTWDAGWGRTLYHNGEKVGEWPGQEHQFSASGLGVFNLGSQVMTGSYGRALRYFAFSYDEVYAFDYELTGEQVRRLMEENRPPERRNPPDAEAEAAWAREHFGLDGVAPPMLGEGGLAARVLPVQAVYARMPGLTARPTRTPMDGMDMTPHLVRGEPAEEVTVRFDGAQRFNYLRVVGDIEGAVAADGVPLASLPGAVRVQRRMFDRPVEAEEAVFEREQGTQGTADHIDFYDITPLQTPPALGAGAWRAFPRPASPAADREERAKARMAAYYGAEEGTVFAAGPGPGERASMAMAPWRFYHFVTDPLPEDRAVNRILLDLRLAGVPNGGTAIVRMHDPVTLSRRLLEFEARFEGGPGAQPVRLLFENQDFVFEAGRRLGFAVMLDRPAEMLLGPEGTSLAFEGDLEAHGDRYLAAAARVAADLFVAMSEAQPWSARSHDRNPPRDYLMVGYLFGLCEHVLHFRPREQTAAALYSWMLRNKSRWKPEAAARYENRDPMANVELADPGVEGPDWAVYGREALKATRAYMDWWANERQAEETGLFGGGLGDDTTLVTGFVNFALIHDPGNRLREAVRRLADYTWQTSLDRGLNIVMVDHLHAYEEGANVQHLLPRLFYGDPKYVERMMITSQFYEDHLTGVNPQGDRLLRSHRFSASMGEPPPGSRFYWPHDRGMAMIFHPGRVLAWYNGNPTATRVLCEWMDAWLRHSANEPSSEYFGLGAIDFATGERVSTAIPGSGRARNFDPENPGSGERPTSGIWEHMFWAYEMTGEERYRRPVVMNLSEGLTQVRFNEDRWVDWRALIPPDEVARAEEGMRRAGIGSAYLRWQLGGERAPFIEALKEDILEAKTYMPVHTWVGQSTDRIRLPQDNVPNMYLGGPANRTKRLGYHFHAVSWEGADDDVSRFVVEKSRRHLKVLLYSFHDRPQDVLMRVWQLDPGIYRVRTGVDRTGDEEIDGDGDVREMELFRYEGVALAVPPKQGFVVEVEQVRAHDERIQDRPDLAVGEVRFEGGAVEVAVHNIGGKPSPGTVLRLVRSGEVLGEAPVPPIEAPLDLQPRKVTVALRGIANPYGALVVVDPAGRIPEITKANNFARLPEQ